MTALTVGVTTAKQPECKRGIAANIGAALARHSAVSARVSVVDADPLALDVTTRLGVRGPYLEDFAGPKAPQLAKLGHLHSPAMTVVPSNGGPVARIRLAADKALPELKAAHDVVVCDLPGGPTGPGLALGARLELLDWLVLAVTPNNASIAAANHFLEHFETAKARGDVGDVRLAIVATGDESSMLFETQDVELMLGVNVAARVPQLWGRAEPNFGFGPALAIPELDDAVYDLLMQFRMGHEHRSDLVAI